MAMTKADLVSIISDKSSFSRQESYRIVEQVFQIIKKTLEAGEKIKISGFGNFIHREKGSRRGRNPQTGEEVIISARRVLTFKPSAIFRRAVNQDNQISETIGIPLEKPTLTVGSPGLDDNKH
jgi:integration host factor subunit alpha